MTPAIPLPNSQPKIAKIPVRVTPTAVHYDDASAVNIKALVDKANQLIDAERHLAEETIANTFECGVKLLRVREPQELAQIQTDFLSRQAQAIANHTKEVNECFVKGAEQLANTAAGSARKAA